MEVKIKNRIDAEALLNRILKLTDESEIPDSSLAWGRAGLILLYAYCGKYQNDAILMNKAINLINESIEDLFSENTSFNSCNLYNGIIGFLSVLSNLHENKIIDISDFDFDVFNPVIDKWLEKELSENGNFDLVNGPLGVMIFLRQRLGNKSEMSQWSENCLNQILKAVENNCVEKTETGTFLVNKYYNAKDYRESSHINFGLAHGLTGLLIGLHQLTDLSKKSINNNSVVKLIDTMYNLSNYNCVKEPYSFVSDYVIENAKPMFQKRLGWCHSDLNNLHALILHNYNNSFNEKIEKAINNLIKRRDYEFNGITDPFICHGYAGVAQYFYHLHSIYENNTLIEEYNFYIDKTLDFYKSVPNEYFFSNEFTKTNSNISFFYGNTGPGLVMLSYLYPHSKTWSQIILL